ncbi:hypothetical protein Hanom_Chr15g01414001 [Helianthus anomalus]
MESVTSIPRQVEVFTLLSTGDWRRPYRYSNLPCKSIYFDGFQVVVDDWLVNLFILRLVVFEPNSKHIQSLGIDGDVLSFFVYPYVESLLLLVYCLQ